jgi:nickel/cobalt transporter (NicO) family protein
MKRTVGLLAAGAVGVLIVLAPASPASAHPLGNFSINEYVGLTLQRERVLATAIVDAAEIPTLQDRSLVDSDHDGSISDTERAAHAARTCRSFVGDLSVQASDGNQRLMWSVTRADFTYAPGAGGLAVSRLACSLTAPARLGAGTTVSVENRYLADRVGWREMTATGDGLRLVNSPLPAQSVSHELRDYPRDVLASPLNVRSATLNLAAGTGSDGVPLALRGDDPVSRAMAALDRRLATLAGGHRLTPLVGVLAVLLALVLGAGHAALPGHGKTVLAAYLAGKQGRPRDALTVAGTVTLSHTGGVLGLGLLITAGTAVAGDAIVGWLGLISGAVVLVVGASMLASVVRRRTHPRDHDHAHPHDHSHDHDHDHPHPHPHEHADRKARLGLAGIGLAGGLVPSPSALVVLLAAIGLGRTAFGVLLVIVYGVGMAATLTGAGLLLLALQRRLARAGRSAPTAGIRARVAKAAAWLNAATPAATATLVLLVGAGLAARAAATVL